ncbi:MAG: YiiD C-terminal domain-containing protein [Chloroflexota bacterium]|nr:YiiD C-terminal domain-containing protein [Chloroflexota bacterium]
MRRDPMRLLKWINFYLPFLGAGIRVAHTAPDYRTIRVEMKLTRLNLNAVGTHFGGSLYAMCDPWFMLMLMHHLGDGYIVWDKAATIQFLRPGRGTVTATFEMPPDRVDEIRQRADAGEKIEPVFVAEVIDQKNEVVARVEKLLYVRRKSEVSQ